MTNLRNNKDLRIKPNKTVGIFARILAAIIVSKQTMRMLIRYEALRVATCFHNERTTVMCAIIICTVNPPDC